MSWAEVHRFDGRLFVVGRWGEDGGRRVADDVGPEALGRELARFLHPRWWHRSGTDWATFCRDVAGVDERDYAPEVRIQAVVVSPHVLVRPLDGSARPDHDAEAQVDERDVAELGRHAHRLLHAAKPIWPTARSATVVTTRDGGLAVETWRATSDGPDVRVRRARTSPGTLAADVRAAMALTEGSGDDDVSAADTAGGAMVVIAEDRHGALSVERWLPAGGGWEPSGDHAVPCTWDTLADTALGQLGRTPSRHVAPADLVGTPFGRKTAWLAVRGRDPAEVADAFGLADLEDAPWDAGVAAAYDGAVFVAPETAGWVLLVGMRTLGTDVARLSDDLAGAEVQAFSTHRVSDSASWALAREGALVRRVEIADGAVVDSAGDATDAESDLAELDPEEQVLRVAAGWSLDPTRLDTTPTSSETGFLAR